MTMSDVLVVLVVIVLAALAFLALDVVAGRDLRAVLTSRGFRVAAGLIVTVSLAFVVSAAIRCWDEWGCDPDPLFGPVAAVVLLLPTPYVVAGLLQPPRPLLTGAYVAVVHLACGAIAAALGLITGPESDGPRSGFAEMGAQIALVLGVIAVALVIATGPLLTWVVARIAGWMAGRQP
jgi:hypothetical protein